MDRGFVERLESRSMSEGNRTTGAGSIMATGLSGVGSAFEGQSLKLGTNEFLHTSTAATDDDDDVVFVELSPSAQNSTPTPLPTSTALPAPPASQAPLEVFPRAETTKIVPHPKEPVAPSVDSLAEPIVIDDEEDADLEQSVTHVSSKGAFPEPNGTSKMDIVGFSSNKLGSPLTHTVISTEPDSEIKIANVTTLDMASMFTNSVQGPLAPAVTTEGPLDMNLMITSVTSLQNASLRELGNGPQISSTFSLNPEVQSAPATTHTDVNRPGVHSGAGTFNPGRIGTTGEAVQNGESGTHQRPGRNGGPTPSGGGGRNGGPTPSGGGGGNGGLTPSAGGGGNGGPTPSADGGGNNSSSPSGGGGGNNSSSPSGGVAQEESASACQSGDVLGIREAGVQGDSEVLSRGGWRECGRFQRNRDREIRGGGGGGKEKDIRFREVEFEVMRVHPGGNSR
ncbi:UNVERIFIED_CONTAM: hypothetical protein FKN15_028278 [Acipenser sinensis]